MTGIQFVIITGLSGAGKSEAIRAFEDFGYFCVDNIPPALIPKFAELCNHSQIRRIALVSDIRGGQFFDSLFESLEVLETAGFDFKILFLEAADETLVRRFKETRRRHPLAPSGGILDGIHEERRRLEGLRGRANRIIDTSNLSPRQLAQELSRTYVESPGERMAITVVSFGFKHGIPIDADMVFDVRFLPNPHYVPSLKPLTGNDSAVVEYVFKWPVAQQFLEKLKDLLSFLLPQFVQEGKSHLLIGMGCTGGQHRSVAFANELGRFVRSKGFPTAVEHRDCPVVEEESKS